MGRKLRTGKKEEKCQAAAAKRNNITANWLPRQVVEMFVCILLSELQHYPLTWNNQLTSLFFAIDLTKSRTSISFSLRSNAQMKNTEMSIDVHIESHQGLELIITITITGCNYRFTSFSHALSTHSLSMQTLNLLLRVVELPSDCLTSSWWLCNTKHMLFPSTQNRYTQCKLKRRQVS